MIPPTSIDGTDITGATIDGTDVQEITVDGDVVFSAQTLPVAYSNLVAWYPFDSAEYGGSNADDVTAILGGSGDDSAYDGTVNGATYQASDGVTDINSGANSGGFEFDGNDDYIELGSNFSETSHTKCGWFKLQSFTQNQGLFGAIGLPQASKYTYVRHKASSNQIEYIFDDGVTSFDQIVTSTYTTTQYVHIAITYDASTNTNNCKMILDGNNVGTASKSAGLQMLGDDQEFISDGVQNFDIIDGFVDDYRIYNKALSQSEINQIIDNTEP